MLNHNYNNIVLKLNHNMPELLVRPSFLRARFGFGSNFEKLFRSNSDPKCGAFCAAIFSVSLR